MTESPPGARVALRRGVARAAALLLPVLLLAPSAPALGAALAPPPAPGGPGPWAGAVSGPCPGPKVVSGYSGSVGVDPRSASAPGVAQLSVELDYRYTLNLTPKSGAPSSSCQSTFVRTTTNGSGGFALNASVPRGFCSPTACVAYAGPYGPLALALPNLSAPGYFVAGSVNGSSATVRIVEALASVTLTPTVRTTVSPYAPTRVQAAALAGNGAPTPAAVQEAWQLQGSGWGFVGVPNGSAAEVEAQGGAGPGLLEVWVNGSYNGTAVSVGPESLELAQVPTNVTGGSVTPTALDVGAPLRITVTGTGAAGYAYTAAFSLGLGSPTIAAACSSAPVAGGRVALDCAATASYGAPGTARPTVNLSNGYSTSSAAYPGVTVADALGLTVVPSPILAYAGAPVRVDVAAVPGTGTPPFGPACLFLSDGNRSCSSAPGSSWSFPVVFPAPGNYTGSATLEDAGGGNRSVPFSASVVARPTLDPIVAATQRLELGTTVDLVSAVRGGAGPIDVWWNASLPAGTAAAAVLPGPGPLALAFLPSAAGLVVVTLTVRDALGTVLAASVTLAVLNGPAAILVATSAQPNGSVAAGEPLALGFVAEDPSGAYVAAYAAPEELEVLPAPGTPGGPLWVNSSAVGPVAPVGADAFPLPPGAWSKGFLNVSVTVARAGTYTLLLLGSLPVSGGGGGSFRLVVGPDQLHLKLSEPSVARAGTWFNETRYRIADRFGNPVPGGYVVVRSDFGGHVDDADSPIASNGSASEVWVNYSAVGTSGGTVYVLSEFGEALLAPLEVPAPPDLLVPVALGLAVAAAAAAGAALYLRRRRRRAAVEPAPTLDFGEEELKRLAEGRAHVLAHVSADEDRDLETIAAGFPGRPPTPSELAEWVASLVAEGVLAAQVGPDGRPRFRRLAPSAPGGPPRVEVDAGALEAALARRDRDDGDAPPGGPEPP